MEEAIFFQLAAILAIAFITAYLIRLMKQPLIIGYIIGGIIVSPFLIKFGATTDVIDIFSKIGIAFLLFIVGLHLNPKVIKDVGTQSLLIGLGQMALTFGITFLISSQILGFTTLASFYVGIALSFSSTIIIMKLLSDKRQLDSLYGKISIGILIIQDLVAVLVLMFISSINGGANFGVVALKTILSGGFLVVLLFLFGFFVVLRLAKSVARSQELLFLFSICWCFIGAALFAFFGFSIEIGALLAGMVLSVSPYSTEISSRIRPLRDFFLIIFFIILGLNLNISEIKGIAINALILSSIALILKPLILMFLMKYFRYTKRTNFLVGSSLAQISEFSLIILMLAVSLGQISSEVLQTLTLTLVITILVSAYFMTYSKKLYRNLSRFLSVFERKKIKKDCKKLKRDYKVVLFGYNRTGFNILRTLTKLKKKYLIVDFNPDVISNLKKFRMPCLYGDVDDHEFVNDLDLDKLEIAISTIPDNEVNEMLIENIRLVNPDAIVIARAENIDDAFDLYKKGADYVLTPHFLGGEHLSKMIKTLKTNKKRYKEEKDKHIKNLKKILKKSKGKLRINPYSNGKFHY